MKAVVTGGAGFIGSHLTERLLRAGHRVVVVDSFTTGRPENLAPLRGEGLTVVRGDLAEPGEWEQALEGADRLFHLAALADIVPSIRQPMRYFESNVVGTIHLLEAARRFGVRRVVYAASSSCYGLAEVFPTPESAPIRPAYPYALTKRIGEELVLHWAEVYGLEANSLRLFNVFGPRSRTTGAYGAVFGVFLAQKLKKQPLTVVGDGTQSRDFVYVTDVAEAFTRAADAPCHGEVFNVGSGRPVSVNRLAELIGGPVTRIPKRPGEPDVTHADISKIRTRLGWKPEVSFEAGVERMLGRIGDWADAPVWTPETIAEATRDWFRFLGKPETVS